jgi:LPS sulfotransferase NodH
LALQTGKWRYDMASDRTECDLEFSPARLRQMIGSIIEQNEQFGRFFELNGICPTTIVYERFEADPVSHIGRLSESLGIADLRHVPAKIKLRKQAAQVNDEWRSRYMIHD